MPWSKQQEQAINTYNKNLLVSAAAGSGKTAVLVERIIKKIINGQLDMKELLVVTFTNAAAAEMKQRIRQALEKAVSDEKNNKTLHRLEKQLLLIDNANISTVHSFCYNLISLYFHHLDIDPKFRLANEQEITLLQNDILEKIIEDEYNLENNDDFLYFADAYGNENGDDELYKIILKVYNYAISQPFPLKWLDNLKDIFWQNNSSLKDSNWGKLAIKQMETVLQKCFAYNELIENILAGYGLSLKAVESDRKFLENLNNLLHTDWLGTYNLLQQKDLFIRWDKSDLDEETKKYLKDNLRKKIKDSIEKLKNTFFAMKDDEFTSDLNNQLPHIIFISNLTKKFIKEYNLAKKEKQIIDYNDLEHFALNILAKEDSTINNLIPSEAALQLQNTYKEIMVDEYQDTNGVQEAIISLIAGKKPKTFFVGDVKQGIYRFRSADPSLFLSKYNSYPNLGENYLLISLSKNFRSRENVLKGINYLFSQLWQEDISELDYKGDALLSAGYTYPDNEHMLNDSIELCLVTNKQETNNENEEKQDFEKISAQSLFIAQKIKKLFEENKQVFDYFSQHI